METMMPKTTKKLETHTQADPMPRSVDELVAVVRQALSHERNMRLRTFANSPERLDAAVKEVDDALDALDALVRWVNHADGPEPVG